MPQLLCGPPWLPVTWRASAPQRGPTLLSVRAPRPGEPHDAAIRALTFKTQSSTEAILTRRGDPPRGDGWQVAGSATTGGRGANDGLRDAHGRRCQGLGHEAPTPRRPSLAPPARRPPRAPQPAHVQPATGSGPQDLERGPGATSAPGGLPGGWGPWAAGPPKLTAVRGLSEWEPCSCCELQAS